MKTGTRLVSTLLVMCMLTVGSPVCAQEASPEAVSAAETPAAATPASTQAAQNEAAASGEAAQGNDATTPAPTEAVQDDGATSLASTEGEQGNGPTSPAPTEAVQGDDATSSDSAGAAQGDPSTSPSPSPTPDAQSGDAASPDPTQGDASASPDPTQGEISPTPTVSPVEGQAWYMDGETKRWGELAALLETAGENTVYIAEDAIIVLTGDAAQAVWTANLAPDPDVFDAEAHVVYISETGPDGETQDGAVFVWVALEGGEQPPEPTDAPPVEAELLVTPADYQAGAWSCVAPSFTLQVVPDTLEGYSFAVAVDSGEPIALTQGEYTATTEGQHVYEFILLDPDGETAARSALYTVWLDTALPEASAQLDEATGALVVTATDALSGVDAVSLDGGASWQAMTAGEDGTFTFTHALETRLEAQMLCVRDAAGNVWVSDQAYEIAGGLPGGGSGFPSGGGSFSGGGSGSLGGSGSSSGETSRTISHSGGSSQEATAYDAVALEVDGESMFLLTLGGETLPLTLTLDREGDVQAEESAAFDAELAVWGESEQESDGAWDTLILTAPVYTQDGSYAYRWDFTGDVYKTLFNSGVRYLVLRVGERVTAISTAGFTAGSAYNALKSDGVASDAFVYSLWMGEPDPALEIEVEVSGTHYVLEAGEGEMYYYDVYAGTQEMMNAAFGAQQ